MIGRLALLCVGLLTGTIANAAEVYLRFKISEPSGQKFVVTPSVRLHDEGAFGHRGSNITVAGGEWSTWVDLTKWPLHGRLTRSGGFAEWPFFQLTLDEPAGITNCTIAVELSDKPDAAPAISFTERGAGNVIGFLLPHPLREKKGEFETGSQMAARHLAWAKQLAGKKPIALERFRVVTGCYGVNESLGATEMETLKWLGFNVIGSAYYIPKRTLEQFGFRTYAHSGLYGGDSEKWKPGKLQPAWDDYLKDEHRNKMFGGADKDWYVRNTAYWAISDEVVARGYLKDFPRDVLNRWFRDYLTMKGVTAADLGKPIAEIEYPADSILIPALPRGDLYARRLQYHMAKFGQWKSANFLREITACYHQVPIKSLTLPTSHGFWGFWGDTMHGMGYQLLDFFEVGAQQGVDIFAAEDWLGLNYMYGPNYTLTGAQSFAYLTALMACAIEGQPMELMSLITPGESPYLLLKAYSTLGQGAKHFYFWDYGPTYVATENYWSDSRCEYEGIADFTRALQKSESILYPAQPVRDPVAILYSVSDDIWNNKDGAAFAENRLTWHALRHLGVQPRFVREEDVEAGKLAGYKLCVLNGACLTRKALAALDEWVKAGGVLYLTAGAATRDEAFEPYLAPFAADVWPSDATQKFSTQGHGVYNERTNLPGLKPLAQANVTLNGDTFALPALGARLNLKTDPARPPFATFDDGGPAAALVAHGRGKIIAMGFLPMLAYSQGANFQPKTLAERWPSEPRKIIQFALDTARIQPVAKANAPVVETSLLTGPAGSALVLANYTYHPIKQLTVDVKVAHRVARAVSTHGVRVKFNRLADGVRLTLPLEWTDIILLPSK